MSVEAITLLRTGRDMLGREVIEVARDGKPRLALDTTLLEAAVSPKGEDLPASAREASLQAAADLYRGPFLAGVTFDDAPELEEWIDEQRAYWQRRVEVVLSRLAALQLERRAHAEAGATARRWIATNALSEPAHRALMRALAGGGDPVAALAAYDEVRAALRTSLGIDPSPETVALAERLRRLPAPSPRRAGADERVPRRAAAAGPTGPELNLPFVGREREFAALVEAYQAARAGQLRVVVLEGEAGIGKTRLAEEFLRWATLEGADVLRSRGHAAGLPSDQVLVDALRPRLARERAPEDLVADVWLAELVRLFPELRERYPDLPPPSTVAADEPAGQGRLNEALLQLVLAVAERARPQALVSFCDDLPETDRRARELLLYRLQRQQDAGAPHLVVLAARSESLASSDELQGWLCRLSRRVPTRRLKLGTLSEAETTQAVAALVAGPPDDRGGMASRLGAWLHARAEGQPFHLVETLRALVEGGLLAPEGDADGAPRLSPAGVERLPSFVPDPVREHVRGQLAGVSRGAFEMLSAVAVLGARATFERARAIAGLEEGAALVALDELGRRRLLVEAGREPAPAREEIGEAATYRFAYPMVGEVIWREAGETRRRIYHRRAFALVDHAAERPAGPGLRALVA